jgi:hypothetical protein
MIPEHVMRELRYIEVYTAKKIRNLRVGAYTSPLRGPGSTRRTSAAPTPNAR